MAEVNVALLRANKRFARQEYDKQMLQNGGAGSSAIDDAGPPNWSRPAWDAFRAQYGRWPYSPGELPPTMAGAPDWVFELMGLRKPPVGFNAI